MSCLLMIFLSLIFLAVTFLTYFGLYVALNNLTRPAQTVTVSSDGPASEMYPDSMGQYKILKEVYRYDRPVYKHVDREDRFIIYAGNKDKVERHFIVIDIFTIRVHLVHH